jgi:PAS domain S-box-containing protein
LLKGEMKKKQLVGILAILIVLPAQSQDTHGVSNDVPMAVSNFIIGCCAIVIASMLSRLVLRNQQWRVFKFIIFPFIAFSLTVGAAYLVDASILWFTNDTISEWNRPVAAIVSLACVAYIFSVYAKAFQMKSPEALEKLISKRTSELSEVNRLLQLEIEVRKEAEKEVTRREKRFKALIENISDGIILSDENFRIIYQSPSVARILGYSFEERQPKPLTEFVHPDDHQILLKLYDDLVLLPGQPLSFQYRLSNYERQYIWVEGVVINLLHDRSVNGYVTNYRNITGRKAVEEALGRERKLLRALIDNVPDYIYIKDNQLRHIINNRANVELIGAASEAETIGKTVMDYFDADLAKEFMEADRKVLDSGVALIDQEEKIIGHNQETRWLLTTKIPLTEHGKVIGLIGISRDITERMRTEIMLKELNASLAIQASKLSASNAELEQFAYVVSHDLQEPLRMVKSFLELLKIKYAGQLDEEACQYIDIAVEGADRMKALIQDLLEYSRLDAVKQEKVDCVDMNQVVQQTIQTLHALINSSGAEIQVNALPTVSGVKLQLGQVIQNLIANAIIYRNNVNLQIVVEADESPLHWRFSIKDNGIGIEERHFAKIFEIFQRLPNENVQKGTGLGLAICKKIVENHDGKIWVESQPGKGSTFRFTIRKK